ncbi:MAG TPA: hypothetical protein VLW50_01940 [Streptosporangiaceae bacterium]|nr:hypothetical protein [Streptosporangiaceae bacterium]
MGALAQVKLRPVLPVRAAPVAVRVAALEVLVLPPVAPPHRAMAGHGEMAQLDGPVCVPLATPPAALPAVARDLRTSGGSGRIELTRPAIVGGPRALSAPPVIAPTLAHRAPVSGRRCLLVVDRAPRRARRQYRPGQRFPLTSRPINWTGACVPNSRRCPVI